VSNRPEDLGPVEFGGGSESRISKYFVDDRDQDLYEEICQAGWDGMVNRTLEIWFGEAQDIGGDPVEDFGFTNLNYRRN
tara:strand:+ start:102 stop:338 length:237 start_codon:yes stop_codon:yes gene_type:complete